MQPADSDPLLESDAFKMFCFKVLPCAKRFVHDWSGCPFAHHTEKARRRCPRTYEYAAVACPDLKQGAGCPRGERCGFAHNVFEQWLHPDRYRTQMCNSGAACNRKSCFFAHSPDQLRFPVVPTIKPLPDQLVPPPGAPMSWAHANSAMCAGPVPSLRHRDTSIASGDDCLTISPSSSPPVSSMNLTLEGQEWSDSSGSSISVPGSMVPGAVGASPALVITLAQLQQEAGPGSALEAALAKEQQQVQLMAIQRQRQQQHEQLMVLQQQRRQQQQSLAALDAAEAQLRGYTLSSATGMPAPTAPGASLSSGIPASAKSGNRAGSPPNAAAVQLDQLAQVLSQLRIAQDQGDAMQAAAGHGASSPPPPPTSTPSAAAAMYLQGANQQRLMQQALVELQMQQQQQQQLEGMRGAASSQRAAMLALAAARGMVPHAPHGMVPVGAMSYPGMYNSSPDHQWM